VRAAREQGDEQAADEAFHEATVPEHGQDVQSPSSEPGQPARLAEPVLPASRVVLRSSESSRESYPAFLSAPR
jgi:hypothetical protein